MAKQLAAYYKQSITPETGAPPIPVANWTGWSGGQMTRATETHPEGGRMRSYAGRPTWSNIVVKFGYDADRDDVWLSRLEKACAEGDPRYTATRQPTAQSGALRGKAEVHTGCAVVGIRRPEYADGTEATVGVGELEFTTDGPR